MSPPLHCSWSFEFSARDLFLTSSSVIWKTNAHTLFSSLITGENVKYSHSHLLSLSTFISASRLNLNHWVWPFKQLCAKEESNRALSMLFSLSDESVLPDRTRGLPERLGWVSWLGFAGHNVPVSLKTTHMVRQGLSLVKLCWLSFAHLVSFIANFSLEDLVQWFSWCKN